jgi:hypothetical protein
MDWLFTCVEPKKIKNPNDVLAKHKAQIPAKDSVKERPEFKPNQETKSVLEVMKRLPRKTCNQE